MKSVRDYAFDSPEERRMFVSGAWHDICFPSEDVREVAYLNVRSGRFYEATLTGCLLYVVRAGSNRFAKSFAAACVGTAPDEAEARKWCDAKSGNGEAKVSFKPEWASSMSNSVAPESGRKIKNTALEAGAAEAVHAKRSIEIVRVLNPESGVS